ncbi:MAG: FtsX-like permease family protein [Chloroflexota bacterium]
MDVILQKIKADITSRPLISLLVVVTIIVASALLTLALATLMNISAPYDKSFEELNAAHLWLYFNRDRIRERDITRIEALPGVVESTGLQYSIESRVRLRELRVWTSIRSTPEEPPQVNQLLVQQGRYLATHQPEILASRDLNDMYKLSLEDMVGITRADGKEIYLPVIGLAYNPTWDTYRNTQPPYLYLSEQTFKDYFPDESTWDWSIGLRLADPEAVDKTLAEIEGLLRSDAIDSHTDWHDVRTSAIFQAQLNFVLLGAFSFFAILATTLVVASSISSIVLSQFKQIGMLKAIGFTQNQILWLYLGQYLLLSLVGSPLGLVLGMLLAPLPLQSVAASLGATFQPPFQSMLVALVLAIIPGIVTLATVGAAYRGARANIIKAIATGAEAPPEKPFWVVTWVAGSGLPMIFVLGLNDVFARPLRSFMTGLNLTLGVIGIVFGLALHETIDAYLLNPALFGITYDAFVSREETSDGRTRHLLQRAPGVEAFYSQHIAEVETTDGKKFQLRALEGELPAFSFRVSKGRFFQPDTYEAMAGKGLLDWLGLSVGDELTLILAGKRERPLTFQIVGQYPESANAGQMLMVSLPTILRFDKEAKPDTYHLKLSPTANIAQLKQYLEPMPGSDLNLSLAREAVPSAIIYLKYGVFVLASILICIALVNVFNTTMLAMREKLRLIGVLKTLGMTPAQVVAMAGITAGALGLLATGLGVPLGVAFTKGLLIFLSEFYGFGEVKVSFNALYVPLLIPLMIGISIAGSYIPGRQAAGVSIVSVLRNE